ncbi:MAG: hypothetical protein V1803_01025 [Candidatus Roizmanbacteria bacterium]
MDQNLSPAEKKKIYEDLFDITFEQLKSKKLSVEEGQILAGFMLDNMESLKNKEELFIFLEKLAKKWSFFNNYFMENKGEKTLKEDKTKIEELTKKLNSFIN